AKAQDAAGNTLPRSGRAFLSVRDEDKVHVVDLGRRLSKLGFEITATSGTAETLRGAGVACTTVRKVAEGRPHIVDRIRDGEIDLVSTPTIGGQSLLARYSIRRETLMQGVPYCITVQAARAAVEAIEALTKGPVEVRSLQEFHAKG